MLRSIESFLNYKIKAQKGAIVGHCKDMLIDDKRWTVRYIEVDTGDWLPGQRVLLSPIGIEKIGFRDSALNFRMTKQEIESSPPLESHLPISRQWEMRYHRFNRWPHYATGFYLWGTASIPDFPPQEPEEKELPENQGYLYDNNLRFFSEIKGYSVQTGGKQFGSVKDVLIDSSNWKIEYFVVSTVRWLPSKDVLVPMDWVDGVSFLDSCVSMTVSKDKIKNLPSFHPSQPINAVKEVRRYDVYGRPYDWVNDKIA